MSILIGLNFTPPYEKYIINTINKIIMQNIDIKNFFTIKKIKKEDIISKFKEVINRIKYKAKKHELYKSSDLNINRKNYSLLDIKHKENNYFKGEKREDPKAQENNNFNGEIQTYGDKKKINEKGLINNANTSDNNVDNNNFKSINNDIKIKGI